MRMPSTHRADLVMACLVVLLAGKSLVLAGESKSAEAARDGFGDPLPGGAVARLGSTRLWHENTRAIALSPDGTKLLTLGDQLTSSGSRQPTIRCWDALTGRLLHEARFANKTLNEWACTPDGKWLALGVQDQDGRDIRTILWDVQKWREIDGPSMKGIWPVAFLADGKTLVARRSLAVREGDYDVFFHLWDVNKGKEINNLRPIRPLRTPYSIHAAVPSRDGKRSAWAITIDQKGSGERHFIQIVEAGARKTLFEWEGHFQGYWSNLALSPNGRKLAWASDRHTFQVWDLDNRKREAIVQISDKLVLEHLTFSDDGKMLACQARQFNGGSVVKLWDVANERFLMHFFVSTAEKHLKEPLSFSADSKTFAIDADGSTRIYDVTTGKERLRIAGHRAAVNHLHFSTDGRSLFSRDGAVVCRWQREKAVAFGIRSSPEIRLRPEIAHLFRDDNASEDKGDDMYRREKVSRPADALDATCKVNKGGVLLDMTGVRPRRISALELDKNGSYERTFVSPDNRRVLLYNSRGPMQQDSGGFEVFDSASGKRLERWPGSDFLNAAFSPDSRLFVWQERKQGKLLLGDLQSGEMKKALATDLSRKPYRDAFFQGSNSIDSPWHTWLFDRLVVSPDNRRVAAVWNSSLAVSAHPFQTTSDQDQEPTTLYVWTVANGKEMARIPFKAAKDKMPQVTSLAFLRDGRTLAAGYLNDTDVHLIEIASGRERAALHGHQGTVRSLVLSPEGRYLLSGSDDTTILVWDLDQLSSASSRPDKVPLSAKEQTRLWEDLASTDAAVAFRAIETLRRRPEPALTLLRERLQPVAEVKPERIQQRIAELDSEEFAVRDRAMKELERLAKLAEPALREALKKPPSLEVRLRLQRVLETIAALTLPPEGLRQVRGVEVLEAIGNDAAREQLKRLAGGASSARLTCEALESLRRPSTSR
jgi:WD40 repeat protein